MSTDLMKSDKVKIEILEYLNEDNKWHSYYDVQNEVGVNYDYLKKHSNFLQHLDLVTLSILEPEESSTGKGSYRVKITERGTRLLQDLEIND